ncbi:MAG: diguanylate cyclase [Planctomycetota bacterium]
MSQPSIPVEFEELKSSGDLPSPTGVGMKILEITRTDEFSAEDMGDAIMSDPSLTGRILELANSAERAGQEPITTVSGAIMRLGATMVRSLALAFSLVSEREAGACRPFDYERYWSLSLARAVAAKALSGEVDGLMPEEAYVAGLLAEVGILALASVHSERYGKLLIEHQNETLTKLRQAEVSEFDIDHATVSLSMLSDWGLPEAFATAIGEFGRKRAFAPSEGRLASLADLLRFADAIGSALMLGEMSPPRHVAEVGDQLEILRDVLELDESEFATMCDSISMEWRVWGERLEIETQDIRFSHIASMIARGRELAEAEVRGQAGDHEKHQGSSSSVAHLETPEGAAPKPAAKPTAAPAAAAAPAAPTPPKASTQTEDRISILAVDDDPVSLRVLVRYLRKEGFEVSMARNGKEGLKKALQEKPDLLVVDHEMPDMSGLEVVRALRRSSLGSSMYILILTGNQEDDLLIEAFDAGVDDFVTKPFLPRLLTARMQAGIRIAKLQRKVDRDRRTILKQLAEKNALNRKLRTASLTDPLTGLPNRRHAMNRVDAEWKATERNSVPFSVIMLDIDHFKSVNDTYGHDIGDIVLQATSQAIKGALRGEDEVCRLGGEEFLIVCRGADEAGGTIVAERVREAVEANVIDGPGFGNAITVSLGVAGVHPEVESLMSLLKAADDAVYQAKNAGRNRVCVAGAPVKKPEETQQKPRRSA